MTQSRPILDYRAAVDDRKRDIQRVTSRVRSLLLNLTTVACMALFILATLSAIWVTAVAIIIADPAKGSLALSFFGIAALSFILMLFFAKMTSRIR